MKRILTTVIVVSLFLPPAAMFGKEREGANLEVTKSDGKKIEGELIGIRKNSSLILAPSYGAPETIDVSDIRSIRIIRKSRALLGAGIGLLVGIPVAISAANSVKKEENRGGFMGGFPDIGHAIQRGVVGIAVLGGMALLGVVVGAAAGTDTAIGMIGIPQSQREAYLQKLRSKARNPEYQ